MNPRLTALSMTVALALGIATGAAAQTTASGGSTSDSAAGSTTSVGSTTALDTQTAQMDSLAVSRGQANVIGKTADTFTDFAGSRENAVNLATGLRTGSEITLTGTDNGSGANGSTTFMPPTKPMGHGNVFKSLALAQQQLAANGIDNPTPQQIEAALNGGTITVGEGADAKTVELQGVLQMRADGMGWGQIAQAQGTKLGSVISGMKSANSSIAKHPKVVTMTPASGTSAGTGITNAADGASTATTPSAKQTGNEKGKGVVNAAGSGSAGSANSSRGIQNAMGGNAGSGHGNAYGKTKNHGIVTATGASAGSASAGAGVVSAGGGGGYGNSAAAGASSHGRGAGVVSAAGGNGQGNAYGRGK